MAITLSSALILLLVAVAVAVAGSVSAHTTVTVVTTTTEEDNPQEPGSSSCATEIQRRMPMRMCMMWMQSKMMGPRANPWGESDEHLEECCGELRMFSSGCRCEAVTAVATAMQQYGPMEEMRRMACSLPDKCGMTQCPCGSGGATAYFD